MSSTFGWTCSSCTYEHRAPGQRCVMCGELRVTRQQMRDFVLGIPVPSNGSTAASKPASSASSSAGDGPATALSSARDGSKPNKPTRQTFLGPSTRGQGSSSSRPAIPSHPSIVESMNAEHRGTTTIRHHPPARLKSVVTAIRNPYVTSRDGGGSAVASETVAAASRRVAFTSSSASQSSSTVVQLADSDVSLAPSHRDGTTGEEPAPPTLPAQQTPQPMQQPRRTVEPSESHPACCGSSKLPDDCPEQHTTGSRSVVGSGFLARANAFERMAAAAKAAVSSAASAPTSKKPSERGSAPAAKERNAAGTAIVPVHFPLQTYTPGPIPLDPEAARHWLYPKHDDFPVRQYQLEMTETALFHNTLVSLPTGLGKTLIAAVVLYNYQRWFPTGRVLFLAPTQPLVNQQVAACGSITNLPASLTAVLTGQMSPRDREGVWKSRRVFFCTPQTVQKDLEQDICPARDVVALVLDEAHKATGEYAYVRVVDLLERAGARFRIVGLSATPGASIKAIQKVVDTLRISKIDARSEQHPTVAPYIHSRRSEIVLVPQASAAKDVEHALNELLHPHLERIKGAAGGLAQRLTGNATVTPFQVLATRQDLSVRDQELYQRLQGYLHVAQTFVQLREYLRKHGVGMVRMRLQALQIERQRGVMSTVLKDPSFQRLCDAVAKASGVDCDATQQSTTLQDKLACNPKLAKLKEILTEHFERAKAGATSTSTRAIVFSQFRDSVEEIVDVLKSSEPLIRPRRFIGQSKSSKLATGASNGSSITAQALLGMKRSEQHQVIRDFGSNVYNVLVCTCIGEEGLDIGEVDLIVNFDTLRNPIRMIQRVGRTGRKREGRVVCLVSEGSEERTLSASRQSERNLIHALKNPQNFKCKPSVPMFPTAPERKDLTMRLSQSFRISQVEGYDAQKTSTDSSKNPARKSKSPVDWRLSEVENQTRTVVLGDLADLHIDVEDAEEHNLPSTLRRHFLAARESSHSSKNGRRDKVHSGRTTTLLAFLESSHPKPDHVSVTAPSRCGDSAIGQIFAMSNSMTANRKLLEFECLQGRHIETPISESTVDGNEQATEIRPLLDLNQAPVATCTSELLSDSQSHKRGTRPILHRRLALSERRGCAERCDTADSAAKRAMISCDTRDCGQIVPSFSRSSTAINPPDIASNPTITNCSSAAATLESTSSATAGEGHPELSPKRTRGEDVFVLPTQADDDSDSGDESTHCSPLKEPSSDADQRDQKSACQLYFANLQPESTELEDAYRLPSDDSSASSSSLMSAEGKQEDCKTSASLLTRSGEDATETVLVGVSTSKASDVSDSEFELECLSVSRNRKRDTFESETALSASTKKQPVLEESCPLKAPTADHAVLAFSANAAHHVRFSLEPPSSGSPNTQCLQKPCGTPLEDTPVGRAPVRHARLDDVVLLDTPAPQPAAAASSEDFALVDTPASQPAGALPSKELRVGTSGCSQCVDDIGCCICRSGTSSDDDPIILCDGPADCVPCPVAVHMSCYSVPKQVLADETWRCDLCHFFYSGGAGRIFCYECGAEDNGGTSVLKRLERHVWHHVGRCAVVDKPPTRKRLRRKGEPSTTSASSYAAVANKRNADGPQGKRRRPLDNVSNSDPSRAARPKPSGRTYSKFIDYEAGIDSDEDVDGDGDEEDAIAALEEEEAMTGFINDSSQLGYSQFTPDPLDAVDPDAANRTSLSAAATVPNETALHRSHDMARELDNEFATPVLNRRHLHRKRDGRQWTDTPPSATSSERGLGNMHFIRSVVEHHRHGGGADEIEAAYQELEREAPPPPDDEDALRLAPPPPTRTVVLYNPHESEDEF